MLKDFIEEQKLVCEEFDSRYIPCLLYTSDAADDV